MPEHPAHPNLLSWFYPLHIDHKVELLDHHRRQLSDRLVAHLKSIDVAVDPATWGENAPGPPHNEDVALLRDVRKKLGKWWDEMLTKPPTTNNEHDYLINHRNDTEPEDRYVKIVEAEAEEIGERPAMVHAYIEMRAREN
jgi:hypothetical protein